MALIHNLLIFLKTALPRYADEKHNKRITFEGYSYNITTVSSKWKENLEIALLELSLFSL